MARRAASATRALHDEPRGSARDGGVRLPRAQEHGARARAEQDGARPEAELEPAAEHREALPLRVGVLGFAVAAWLEDQKEARREPVDGVAARERADGRHHLARTSRRARRAQRFSRKTIGSRGRPSLMSCQLALEATKMCASGRIAKSPSSEPTATQIASGSASTAKNSA